MEKVVRATDSRPNDNPIKSSKVLKSVLAENHGTRSEIAHRQFRETLGGLVYLVIGTRADLAS